MSEILISIDINSSESSHEKLIFLYSDVKPYYDFQKENEALAYDVDSWLGRKFFNEHMVRIQSEKYWFVADVAADLQIGKDFDADFSTTYNNTRAAVIQGGIGKDLNFYAAVYESQGRFAQYFNQYAESIRPDGGNPAIIPGRGIAKEFGEDYDYPVAEGYLSYGPSEHFNVQFGHGKGLQAVDTVALTSHGLFCRDFASRHAEPVDNLPSQIPANNSVEPVVDRCLAPSVAGNASAQAPHRVHQEGCIASVR